MFVSFSVQLIGQNELAHKEQQQHTEVNRRPWHPIQFFLRPSMQFYLELIYPWVFNWPVSTKKKNDGKWKFKLLLLQLKHAEIWDNLKIHLLCQGCPRA